MKEKDWTVIEALRHARHDWMNDMQLVKGLLALNKIDEAARAADHIIVKAVQESKLCNLGMPGMAEMFITFNWEKHKFFLEFEIEDEIIIEKVDDEVAVRFFQALFSLFDRHISDYSGQYLYAGFGEKDGRLMVRIEWDGELFGKSLLIERIEKLLQPDSVSGRVMKLGDQDILMEVNF
ncbi:Spo0B domain-containing protein [Domibacillus epiphyticus]|uniref:Spo0B domain-containing protein n=1 Tax=Domibacillus epiphyticus TaxID=1714355 RepID=UPI001186E97F|nr:Spo0B domain-containing protein [Domibacillus epiphyticus]